MNFKFIKVDPISQFIIVCVVAFQLFLNNGIYLALCTGIFFLLFFLLQQQHKPGVFTLVLFQHFLQIVAGVWLANYIDKDINFRSPSLGDATILSIFGLTVMLAPVIYYQAKLPNYTLDDFKKAANQFSTQKTFYVYLISYFIASSLGAAAFSNAGLTQVIFSFIKVKWLLFILFGFLCIIKKEKMNLFYLAIALEIISGFLGFFSDFKTVLYFLIVLLVSFVVSINVKHIFLGILIGGLLTFLALIWTSIKADYRSFLNGGTKSQSITASKNDALDKLYELSSQVDQNEITSSVQQFLDRLQYTYHFAKTMDRVPEIIPYQDGQNWLENIEFVTTPRILNPDKPTIDNSVKASKYTGLHFLGAKSGVSFSLGYFAECYIDFGYYGMMFPLLLIGIMYALVYRYLMKKASLNILFNYAVVGSFFMEFMAYEMDGTFFLGRFLASLVTYVALIYLFFPWLIKEISIKPDKA